MEKPVIKPATPGLQDIGLSPTPRRLLFIGYFLELPPFDNSKALLLNGQVIYKKKITNINGTDLYQLR